MRKYQLCFILFIFIRLLSAGNPVSLPLGHPVYHYLDRMETLGILPNIRDGVKPLDRERISDLLIIINEKRDLLTSIDREKLDNYLLDFRYEINPGQKYAQMNPGDHWYSPFQSWKNLGSDIARLFARNQPEEENHLVMWEDSTNSFYLDGILGMNYYKRSDDVYRWNHSESFRFRGTIMENLGYLLEVSFYTIEGDEGYRDLDPVLKSSWRNIRGSKEYLDRSGGDLAYRSPFLDFRFANQPVTWGTGESGQLLISDNVEQYPYFSISKDWSWGRFVYMHGKLLSQANGDSVDGQPAYPDKWIVANRLEFSPVSNMSIGLSGMILYGNRYLEWSYLLPFDYLRATEHNLRDRDNALLAIDMEIRVLDGVKTYGTFLIDEFRRDKLFTDWYGNKHGFQFGTHITDPFGLPNLALRFEYVAIMPWVYTHKYNINRFINDGRSLGYWSGPNSEVFYLHLEKDWNQRLTTGIKWREMKHGDNYPNENIGGNILLGHEDLLGDQTEPRETRVFLEGILTTERRTQFYINYEILNDFFLIGDLSWIDSKQEDVHQNLTEFHIGFKFDY